MGPNRESDINDKNKEGKINMKRKKNKRCQVDYSQRNVAKTCPESKKTTITITETMK